MNDTEPTINANVDELKALQREAAEADAQAEQGNDKTPGKPTPAAMPDIPTAQALRLILGPGFQILAPAWAVTPQEVGALADAYGAVIDKWWPDGLGQYGPELAAATVTIGIFMPRIGRPRKLEPKREPKKPAEPAPSTNAGNATPAVPDGPKQRKAAKTKPTTKKKPARREPKKAATEASNAPA